MNLCLSPSRCRYGKVNEVFGLQIIALEALSQYACGLLSGLPKQIAKSEKFSGQNLATFGGYALGSANELSNLKRAGRRLCLNETSKHHLEVSTRLLGQVDKATLSQLSPKPPEGSWRRFGDAWLAQSGPSRLGNSRVHALGLE